MPSRYTYSPGQDLSTSIRNNLLIFSNDHERRRQPWGWFLQWLPCVLHIHVLTVICRADGWVQLSAGPDRAHQMIRIITKSYGFPPCHSIASWRCEIIWWKDGSICYLCGVVPVLRIKHTDGTGSSSSYMSTLLSFFKTQNTNMIQSEVASIPRIVETHALTLT